MRTRSTCCVKSNNSLNRTSTTARQPVGYALCFHTYSTWEGKSLFLEDLYVRPSHRKSGVGRQLFEHAARCAKERNCKRLDFHVLSWNPAKAFYEKMGAVNLSETEKWQYYRLSI